MKTFSLIIMGFLLDVSMSFHVRLFTSTHCRQCKLFQPIYNDLVEKNPLIEFEHVNIVNDMELAKKCNIKRIPTIVFPDDGGNQIICVPRNYEEVYKRCEDISIDLINNY